MRGLRLVVTTADYEQAVRFFRDGLGMAEQFRQHGENNRVVILDAGLATLEIGDPGNAHLVDELEVGRRVAGPLRLALEVEDAHAATEVALSHGASLVAPPVRTPWGSLNARLDAPGGLHLTLYTNEAYVATTPTPDGQVHLAGPDPQWAATGARLAAEVRRALGATARLVEHAGSTAVPGLSAKPVIDLILAVDDPADEDAYVPALEQLGYTLHLREPEWHEHRLLKHADPVTHLHVFALGSTEVERMLAFRDHLRADSRDRALYEETKRDLAGRTWPRVQDYADAKSRVVREVTARAMARPARLGGAFVLVTGSPGGGRTTLARGLAPALGLPLLATGTVQEALVAALPAPDAETSRPLGAAAESVVLAMAADSGGAVLEGPWQRSRVTALPGPVVEVSCSVDQAAAQRPGGGAWPVLVVDTSEAVDLGSVVRQVRQLVTGQGDALDRSPSSLGP